MIKFFATDASSSAKRWIGFSKNIQRSIHVSNTNNSLHVPIGTAIVVKGRESVFIYNRDSNDDTKDENG